MKVLTFIVPIFLWSYATLFLEPGESMHRLRLLEQVVLTTCDRDFSCHLDTSGIAELVFGIGNL